MNERKLRVLTLLVATLVPLVCLEVFFQILPVAYDGARRMPVDEANPTARFEPDREFTWSRDWNFSLVNDVKVNNVGFVSDFDYDANASRPLLAVIGDSYVEAFMVPYRQTCAGRLAETLAPDVGVYSFGMSGAPLSQYLAFARYARDAFHPEKLVIVVVGNDYDESLLEYAPLPGYHYFVERGDGRLLLERIDHSPGFWYNLARLSALCRYLAQNLNLGESLRKIDPWRGSQKRDPAVSVGHTSASAGSRWVADSKRAVDTFLEQLPEFSGLDPQQIAFVVDGMRHHLYDGDGMELADGSFEDVMRRYFLANARRKGYETIDMQPAFLAHYREHRQRFEWPQDAHWNALGHERCFDAVAHSELLAEQFSRSSK